MRDVITGALHGSAAPIAAAGFRPALRWGGAAAIMRGNPVLTDPPPELNRSTRFADDRRSDEH
jgi:hypothetical protein